MKASIALLTATLLCAAALADDRPDLAREKQAMRSVEATFDSLDRNGDQCVSKSEASVEKTLADRFAAVDANGDGFLDKYEYASRPSDERFE